MPLSFEQEGTKKLSNVGKKESIPMQNTHDLLVGTISKGIPSNNNNNELY